MPTYTWMAAAVMLVGALTACGTGDDGGATTVAAAPAAPASADTTPAPAAAGTGVAPAEPVLVNRLATPLGTVATDAAGLTLYRFDNDTNEPPRSACEGICTENWLPLTTTGVPVPGAGVDGARLGTVEREDGSLQATLKGWPLYRFVGDELPGDTNGEGIQGIWHAIAPNGKPAAEAKVAEVGNDGADGSGSSEPTGGEQEQSAGKNGYGY